MINQEIARIGARGYGDGLNSGMVIGLPPILNFAKEPLRTKVLDEVFSGEKVIFAAHILHAGGRADNIVYLLGHLRGFRRI